MITPDNHLSDDVLSARLDAQLAPDEARAAQAHLDACPACERRLAELRAVVTMLRDLPEVELPRDFSLGPRLVADPPNVIRLERLYTWSRTAAASLAAVFVVLLGGTVLLDSARPLGTGTQTAFEAPASGGAANQAARPAAPAAPPAPAAALRQEGAPSAVPAPASAPAPAPAAPAAVGAAADAGARSGVAMATPDASDQVKAATSVSALATPTAPPLAQARNPAPDALAPVDSAVPLRAVAGIAGVLSVVAVLAALIVRGRLREARSHPTGTQE